MIKGMIPTMGKPVGPGGNFMVCLRLLNTTKMAKMRHRKRLVSIRRGAVRIVEMEDKAL